MGKGKQMWVPSSADVGDRSFIAGIDTSRPVVDRCHVPTGPGTLCGTPFYENENPTPHILLCLRRNHEHIVAARERQHPDILKPWDTEFAEWLARNGEAVLEGRKRC